MNEKSKRTEVLVGLFLLIGFGFVAAIVVMFGRVGGGLQKYYKLTVEFPNASGLIKGSDVLLAGARVGRCSHAPVLIANTYHVEAELEIREQISIPRGAHFVVGSSGLLGDRYVDIQLAPGFNPANTYQPGERISGTHAGGGLEELTNRGGAVMDQISAELEHIRVITTRLNEGLLHDRNLKNIEDTFANLRAATEQFKVTSQSLEGLVGRAKDTVETANTTIMTANGAAGDLRMAIADLRRTIDAVAKTADTTSALMKKASEGGGPLGTLINDKKMTEDLKVFVGNLRRSGVLFYKNRPLDPDGPSAPAPATPTPRRR